MTPIESFSGRYRFLSNFYPAQVVLDGAAYPSVEHAYQARKTDIQAVREVIRNAKTAGQAKALGRNVTLVPGWDAIRVPVMLQLLEQKFADKVLRAELLDTGDAQIVEGNTWNDHFWGVCKGRGENMLGKLLMAIRTEIARNK
jgi:ribA/ribD-fused uncharacterized protein